VILAASLGAHAALFGAGVASFLAPCVAPLVPVYLGMVAGEATTGDPSAPNRAVGATLLFVAGFTTVFVALGIISGRAGAELGDAGLWVTRIGGVAVVIFGVVMLSGAGSRLLREGRPLAGVARSATRARAYVIGVAFGAAWSPCVGPLLGAALVSAAASGNALDGATLLIAYALGLGVPFVVASLGLSSSDRVLAWLSAQGPRIEKVAGASLVVLGVLLVSGVYTELTGSLARLAPGRGF
jgi:cytochrome c-type biogenesis protein